MHSIEYVVVNENTLGYRRPGSEWIGVLAGSVIRGGHDPMNGPFPLAASDVVRSASIEDFRAYRVSPVGHLVEVS